MKHHSPTLQSTQSHHLPKLLLIFLGINLVYFFKICPYIPSSYSKSSFIYLFFHTICCFLTLPVTKPIFQCCSAPLQPLQDKISLLLTFSALIFTYELFWKSHLLDFPASSLGGSILIYLSSLFPLYKYSNKQDQVLHWALLTSYSIITNTVSNFLTTELVLIYGLGAMSLFYFTKETKDILPDTGRSDVFEFIKRIFAVFLEDTDSLYIVINRHFEISFASKSFTEAFGIGSDQFKSSKVKEFLQKITNIDCIQRIKQLSNHQDKNNSEDTLQNFAELLFKHAQTFKSQGLGWDTTHQKSKIHLTQALIEGQPFDLHFTYIEEDSQNDFLLFKIDFEDDDSKATTISTPEPEKKLSVTEVAAIAHELRTPLNGLIFFTQQSLNSNGTSSQVKQEFLEPSLHSAKRLNP